MTLDIEMVLDWQQRGMNARVLGLPQSECPLRVQDSGPQTDPLLPYKLEAWCFGWAIENATRVTAH